MGATAKEREAEYKALRTAKVERRGDFDFPRCDKCCEAHLRCPGPTLDDQEEWNFTTKCLRCVHKGCECNFHGEKYVM